MIRLRVNRNNPEGKIFSLLAMLVGLGISMSLPILPNFVKTIINTDSNVSIFYSAMSVILILAAIFSTVFFNRLKRTTITKLSFLFSGLSIFFLIFTSKLPTLSVLWAIRICCNLYLFMTFILFVKDLSTKKNLAEHEGKFYKYDGFGYLIGPILGGFLAAKFGYEIVFIISTIIFISGLAYFNHLHLIKKHPAIIDKKEVKDKNIFQNIKEFTKIKNLRISFMLMMSFMSWISFKRLYLPLYVAMSGYLESMTGVILALCIVPLILIEQKVGRFADRKGVRIPMSAGFAIIGLVFLIIFISPFPLLNFALIIFANIGAGLIEPLQEYYFFRNIPNKEENNLYGIFTTADPLAFFITPAIGAVILFFLPFNFLFLAFAGMMFGTSAFAWATLKEEA